MIQVQWTCASVDEARNVIKILLREKIIACANIIPQIESHYVWEGELEKGDEVKVNMKTFQAHYRAIKEKIVENCSYDIPEISYIELKEVHPPYKKWARGECG